MLIKFLLFIFNYYYYYYYYYYIIIFSQHRGFLNTFLVTHHRTFCLEKSSPPRFLWCFIYRRHSCNVLGLIHGGTASPRENLQPCWRGCCLSLGPLPSTNLACLDLRGAIAFHWLNSEVHRSLKPPRHDKARNGR